MKIGVLFEGSPLMGGGFFQSLKSSMILNTIEKYSNTMEFILTDTAAIDYLSDYKFKTQYLKKNFLQKYFSELFEIDLIRNLFFKLKISHPFTNFINKEKYDLLIFLGPSNYSKFCHNINFVINIWDLDHKKNSQYPEHKENFIFEKREKIINETIFRAFRIIVPHHNNKKDLIDYYKAPTKNILVQTFIPILPTLFLENKKSENDYKIIYDTLNLDKEKKIIFYPSQFWAHKNHMYIINAAEILKKNNDNKYVFVFSGTDKGNYKYIKNLIIEKNLSSIIKIFTFLPDQTIISLYLNCSAVIMPTSGGPTNLPLYESFYFRKVIFYNQDLIIDDDEISKNFIGINIHEPNDLIKKIEILFEPEKVNSITNSAIEYYNHNCNDQKFINLYTQIFKDYEKISSQWK